MVKEFFEDRLVWKKGAAEVPDAPDGLDLAGLGPGDGGPDVPKSPEEQLEDQVAQTSREMGLLRERLDKIASKEEGLPEGSTLTPGAAKLYSERLAGYEASFDKARAEGQEQLRQLVEEAKTTIDTIRRGLNDDVTAVLDEGGDKAPVIESFDDIPDGTPVRVNRETGALYFAVTIDGIVHSYHLNINTTRIEKADDSEFMMGTVDVGKVDSGSFVIDRDKEGTYASHPKAVAAVKQLNGWFGTPERLNIPWEVPADYEAAVRANMEEAFGADLFEHVNLEIQVTVIKKNPESDLKTVRRVLVLTNKHDPSDQFRPGNDFGGALSSPEDYFGDPDRQGIYPLVDSRLGYLAEFKALLGRAKGGAPAVAAERKAPETTPPGDQIQETIGSRETVSAVVMELVDQSHDPEGALRARIAAQYGFEAPSLADDPTGREFVRALFTGATFDRVAAHSSFDIDSVSPNCRVNILQDGKIAVTRPGESVGVTAEPVREDLERVDDGSMDQTFENLDDFTVHYTPEATAFLRKHFPQFKDGVPFNISPNRYRSSDEGPRNRALTSFNQNLFPPGTQFHLYRHKDNPHELPAHVFIDNPLGNYFPIGSNTRNVTFSLGADGRTLILEGNFPGSDVTWGHGIEFPEALVTEEGASGPLGLTAMTGVEGETPTNPELDSKRISALLEAHEPQFESMFQERFGEDVFDYLDFALVGGVLPDDGKGIRRLYSFQFTNRKTGETFSCGKKRMGDDSMEAALNKVLAHPSPLHEESDSPELVEFEEFLARAREGGPPSDFELARNKILQLREVFASGEGRFSHFQGDVITAEQRTEFLELLTFAANEGISSDQLDPAVAIHEAPFPWSELDLYLLLMMEDAAAAELGDADSAEDFDAYLEQGLLDSEIREAYERHSDLVDVTYDAGLGEDFILQLGSFDGFDKASYISAITGITLIGMLDNFNLPGIENSMNSRALLEHSFAENREDLIEALGGEEPLDAVHDQLFGVFDGGEYAATDIGDRDTDMDTIRQIGTDVNAFKRHLRQQYPEAEFLDGLEDHEVTIEQTVDTKGRAEVTVTVPWVMRGKEMTTIVERAKGRNAMLAHENALIEARRSLGAAYRAQILDVHEELGRGRKERDKAFDPFPGLRDDLRGLKWASEPELVFYEPKYEIDPETGSPSTIPTVNAKLTFNILGHAVDIRGAGTHANLNRANHLAVQAIMGQFAAEVERQTGFTPDDIHTMKPQEVATNMANTADKVGDELARQARMDQGFERATPKRLETMDDTQLKRYVLSYLEAIADGDPTGTVSFDFAMRDSMDEERGVIKRRCTLSDGAIALDDGNGNIIRMPLAVLRYGEGDEFESKDTGTTAVRRFRVMRREEKDSLLEVPKAGTLRGHYSEPGGQSANNELVLTPDQIYNFAETLLRTDLDSDQEVAGFRETFDLSGSDRHDLRRKRAVLALGGGAAS